MDRKTQSRLLSWLADLETSTFTVVTSHLGLQFDFHNREKWPAILLYEQREKMLKCWKLNLLFLALKPLILPAKKPPVAFSLRAENLQGRRPEKYSKRGLKLCWIKFRLGWKNQLKAVLENSSKRGLQPALKQFPKRKRSLPRDDLQEVLQPAHTIQPLDLQQWALPPWNSRLILSKGSDLQSLQHSF
jgi:hypothetical protein